MKMKSFRGPSYTDDRHDTGSIHTHDHNHIGIENTGVDPEHAGVDRDNTEMIPNITGVNGANNDNRDQDENQGTDTITYDEILPAPDQVKSNQC